MTERELVEKLKEKVDSSVSPPFERAFELQKRLEETVQQLTEITEELKEVKKVTTAYYMQEVWDITRKMRNLEEELWNCKEELQKSCEEACEKGNHLIITTSFEHEVNGRTIPETGKWFVPRAIYTADFCPICGKFVKIVSQYVYCSYYSSEERIGDYVELEKDRFLGIYKRHTEETRNYGRISLPHSNPNNFVRFGDLYLPNNINKILPHYTSIANSTENQDNVNLAEKIIALCNKITELKEHIAKFQNQLKDMCELFGHTAGMPSLSRRYITSCQCCGKQNVSYNYLMSTYKESPFHGCVDFDYAQFEFGYKGMEESNGNSYPPILMTYIIQINVYTWMYWLKA